MFERIFRKKVNQKIQLIEKDPNIEVIKKAIFAARMPKQVEEIALRELDKLSKVSSSSPEYTIGLNYLEFMTSLPWNKMTHDNLDIRRAEEILNQDHYGLKEVKERILEFLAVRRLKVIKKPRILVVDDEEITCQNLKHVLDKEGYEVITTTKGEEALRLIEESPFQMIITDLKMQGVDGIKILEYVKAKDPSIQVVLITGYGTVEVAVEAMKKGSYQFLSKPLKLEQIKEVVRNGLGEIMEALEPKGPILCFVGPPGTGKTSLGKSIAKSLQRKFVSMSLGGLKDEAQIKGHRRSYVGALPGRIIQEIRRAKSKNPVFMLDELDKIGKDFKGDPASSLLEVLDPEQNAHFVDHYLDVPFDLSKVMFIATANTLETIPAPLLDRLEVIPLSGYTEEEKVQISIRHLIPKEAEENGLKEKAPFFTEEAIREIIRGYTKEAGLRNLKRQIASILRKLAANYVRKKDSIPKQVSKELVQEILGPPKFSFEMAQERDRIGVATGIALTVHGGEIIFIEATKMKGKGDLILTGSLGEVMKESAMAALSFIRANALDLGLEPDFLKETDIHVHVPAGAIPKDGPSAGLAILIAMLSVLINKEIKRDIAMTGEITLTGRILPVGGLRDKLLAANRAEIKYVIVPQKNAPELSIIPKEIISGLNIILVQEVHEVIDRVFRRSQFS